MVEALLGPLCFLGVVGLFVVGFGGLLFWSLYLQPKSWSERWARSASELGLALEPFHGGHSMSLAYRGEPSIKQRMVGQRGGLPVAVGIRIVRSGSGKNRQVHYYTYVDVRYPHPLGMGLVMQAKSALGRLWESVAGSSDLEIGDPRIDPHYNIQGADPEHVRRLLRMPYVLEALSAIAGATFRPTVRDDGLRLEARHRELRSAPLAPVIDCAVDVAHRLLAARGEIGDSRVDQAIASAMRRVAAERGLEHDAASALVRGRIEGMYVEADARLEGGRWTTEFTARFDRPLGLSLRLTKQTSLGKLGALLGGQDIVTGDPSFDDRFIVKGSPTAAVKAALTPEVRARLSALQDTAEELRVEDDRIVARVGYAVSDPARLDAGLYAMARVAATLARVHPVEIGPFRS